MIESLQLVAANHEVQAGVLPAWAYAPDEIALHFDDAMQYARQIAPAGFLAPEVTDRMQEIDGLWTRKGRSGVAFAPEFWTLDAVKHDPKWERARQMARAVLASLGVPLRRPNLSGITYVPSRRNE